MFVFVINVRDHLKRKMADTENLQTMEDTEDPQTMVDTEDPDKFAEEIIETGMEIVETRKTVRKSYIIQEVST